MASSITDTYMAIKLAFILILLSTKLGAQTAWDEITEKYSSTHQEIIKIVEEEEDLESDEYPESLKSLYYKAYEEAVNNFIQTDHISDNTNLLQSILESLEYKEDEVSQLADEVEAHKKELVKKKYKGSYFLDANFLSWQREIELKSSLHKSKIILTNQAYCLGGGYKIKNAYYAFKADGCLFSGTGDSKEKKSPPFYKESNVPNFGGRLSLNAGLVVSSSGAEIGLKLPLLFVNQDIKSPSNSSYQLKEENDFHFIPSLYSAWPLGKYFVQTEIGTFLDQSSTFYALGLGFTFAD